MEVPDLCSRLQRLETKHARLLESLGSAVSREREAVSQLYLSTINQEQLLKKAVQHVEEKFTQQQESAKQLYENQIDSLDKIIEELEKSVETWRLESKSNQIDISPTQAENTNSLELETLHEEHSIQIKAYEKTVAVLEKRCHELESMVVTSRDLSLIESCSAIDDLKLKLEETKKELDLKHNKCAVHKRDLDNISKTNAQQKDTISVLEMALRETGESKDQFCNIISNLEGKNAENCSFIKELQQENQDLKETSKRLRQLLDQHSVLSGGSQFAEFIEIKSKNKQLDSENKKMKRMIKGSFKGDTKVKVNLALSDLKMPLLKGTF